MQMRPSLEKNSMLFFKASSNPSYQARRGFILTVALNMRRLTAPFIELVELL